MITTQTALSKLSVIQKAWETKIIGKKLTPVVKGFFGDFPKKFGILVNILRFKRLLDVSFVFYLWTFCTYIRNKYSQWMLYVKIKGFFLQFGKFVEYLLVFYLK